jgi:carboxypeptidase C (cathepsin A)
MPTPKPTAPTAPTSSTAAAGGKTYAPPKGAETTMSVTLGGAARSRARVTADWLLIREHGVPTAEVFYTSYILDAARSRGASTRPVTFLFNGGPGAASAFLHLGTAGPRRLAFGKAGSVLPPPATLVDNAESWLPFTDLVFVDPVGTGLSRTVAESKLEQFGVDADDEAQGKSLKALPEKGKSFFKVQRDISVLTEFVAQWLSREHRWDSPVSIAGESYGGFRVGKLVRALPERGIGLCGAVMISPAIDLMMLDGGEYVLHQWLHTIPTMALTARYHGKARERFASMPAETLRTAAETFAERELAPLMLLGERADQREMSRALTRLADLIGLPPALVARHRGRMPIDVYGRELLRDENRLLGLYDAAVSAHNMFPDRDTWGASPDPTLAGIMAGFTSGINTVLRRDIGLSTSREYRILSEEVFRNWTDDRMRFYSDRALDCSDDLRYGLGMNPSLKLLICHGWYDLVTTYFSSEQAVSHLRLPEAIRRNVHLRNYDGGHMFYSWERSRKAVAKDVRAVVGA